MKYFYLITYYLVMAFIGYLIGNYISNKYLTPTQQQPTPEIVYEYTAEFSAYTLSEEETDGDPCIGSRNLNLCKLKPILEERGLKICASRDLPLDTMISIEGVGECIILDRMSIRYKGTGNIDILMDSKLDADNFGRKQLNYYVF